MYTHQRTKDPSTDKAASMWWWLECNRSDGDLQTKYKYIYIILKITVPPHSVAFTWSNSTFVHLYMQLVSLLLQLSVFSSIKKYIWTCLSVIVYISSLPSWPSASPGRWSLTELKYARFLSFKINGFFPLLQTCCSGWGTVTESRFRT